MTTTERIKDTLGAAAGKLKHVAQTAAETVKLVARHPEDLVNVVKENLPNVATAARTVILERTFAAAPSLVFKAWTDPEIVGRWWGPEGFTTTDIEMDVRVAGRWSNTMVARDGKRYPSAGEYREVLPAAGLVMFDEGKGEPMNGHATKIEVTFEPAGAGTKMRLVHGVFKTVEMRDECKQGWSSSFDRLARLLDEK
ncbi:MAG: SRPBCC domain-containing protein [Deltaproteobacteria bacterium]|nr:SRPBCC domain-containing protein [Deltaproteobacteria bacterium]